jgi:hypothetical protein
VRSFPEPVRASDTSSTIVLRKRQARPALRPPMPDQRAEPGEVARYHRWTAWRRGAADRPTEQANADGRRLFGSLKRAFASEDPTQ